MAADRAGAWATGMLCTWLMACSTTGAPQAAPARPSPAPDASVAWSVDVDDALTMTERVCWRGFHAGAVMPEAAAGLRFARAHDDDGAQLRIGPRGVSVSARQGCVTLTIELARAAAALDDSDSLTWSDGALYGSPDVWLWRPEPWPEGMTGTLRLQTPPSMSVSVPWPTTTEGSYQVSESSWRMLARFALGSVAVRPLDVGGARLSVARLPGRLSATDAGIDAWLSSAAASVATVPGRFPSPTLQVLLVPTRSGDDVGFGMAMRGGGPTVVLLVGSDATDEHLLGEWVLTHELSHLLLPQVRREDAWLSEGMASYYQNVLRARAGTLTDEEAWGSLVDGFDRGRAAASSLPLGEASARMGRDFAFLHVYWGGAAVLLQLDVALRQRGSSLDAVLAAARARYPHDRGTLDARLLVRAMAEVAPAGVDVAALVDTGLARPFLDVDPLLSSLGVRRGAPWPARLEQAALSSVRAEITTAPSRSASDAGAPAAAYSRAAARP